MNYINATIDKLKDLIKADLHTHTNFSDGSLKPSQLIDLSYNSGIRILSITDHDNVFALNEAIRRGKEIGVQVIPGVELSADFNEREIHILGYFIDHTNKKLLDFLNTLRKKRVVRTNQIIEKLNELGCKINLNSDYNLNNNISIGRPHIAIKLVKEGCAASYNDAFIKYLGDDKPAYVKKPNPSSKEIINLISETGGLSFLAHPGKNFRDESLQELIDLGIDGIETIHPSHSEQDTEFFNNIASENFLLTSGGSDFHGGMKNDQKNFGKYFVTNNELINMKRRLFN